MALQSIDMLLCPAIEGAALTAPPASPAAGACYLVAIGATGAWSGQDGSLAALSEGGWRFVAPVDGARVMDRTNGQMLVHRNGDWESGVVRAQEVRINDQTVLRNRQAAIPDPAGGSAIDVESRAAVAAILASLRTHGLIG